MLNLQFSGDDDFVEKEKSVYHERLAIFAPNLVFADERRRSIQTIRLSLVTAAPWTVNAECRAARHRRIVK